MNQSLLILADFVPAIDVPTQTIGLQEIDVEKLFNNALKNKKQTLLCVNPDIKDVLNKILNNNKVIRAAGGLVKNGQGEYLFIYRLGKWDLPKGKAEANENFKEAAKREVEEECGVNIDYVGKKISTTYHLYQIHEKLVIKQTKWYEMGINDIPELIPQKEEDITKAKWLRKKDLQKVYKNTYPLIKDIMALIK